LAKVSSASTQSLRDSGALCNATSRWFNLNTRSEPLDVPQAPDTPSTSHIPWFHFLSDEAVYRRGESRETSNGQIVTAWTCGDEQQSRLRVLQEELGGKTLGFSALNGALRTVLPADYRKSLNGSGKAASSESSGAVWGESKDDRTIHLIHFDGIKEEKLCLRLRGLTLLEVVEVGQMLSGSERKGICVKPTVCEKSPECEVVRGFELSSVKKKRKLKMNKHKQRKLRRRERYRNK